MEFVRFGGLSPVKQTQYKVDAGTYHNPPKRKGIYAFVYPYIELFLISSTNKVGHISNKSSWIKDENGNLIPSLLFFDDEGNVKDTYKPLLKKYKINNFQLSSSPKKGVWYTSYIKKPRTFKYNGLIWHHFADFVKQEDIFESKGTWIKTDMITYKKALKKYLASMMRDCHKIEHDNNIELSFTGRTDPFDAVGILRIEKCRDSLEVFIEKL